MPLLIRAMKIVAMIWFCLYGLFVVIFLITSLHDFGLWGGWKHFARVFSPWNLLSFIFRIIELSPAALLWWGASKLEDRRLQRISAP